MCDPNHRTAFTDSLVKTELLTRSSRVDVGADPPGGHSMKGVQILDAFGHREVVAGHFWVKG